MTVPDSDLLHAGAHSVEVSIEKQTEVVQGGLGRGVTTSHTTMMRSNQAPIIVLPEVTSLSPEEGYDTAILSIHGERLWHEDSESCVLMGDAAIEVQEPGVGDGWTAPSATQIQIPLQGLSLATPPLPAGDYPVRVMVNGALSMEAPSFHYSGHDDS
jgi:hypothetical protein